MFHTIVEACEPGFPQYIDVDGSADEDEMAQHGQHFVSNLHECLRGNNFSNIPETCLPIPVPEIARRNERHSSELVLESIAFAIMSGNHVLLEQMLATAKQHDIDISPIYPFHMAAAFLDGGGQCCTIFMPLIAKISGRAVKKERFVNEYGHTVLDSFLLTIIRSHTIARLKDIDSTLTDSAVIPGQEIDICGRWLADSPCFRTLVASGETTIPASWKHKFCHTSIQAIVHSTLQLLDEYPTMLNLSSGLFKHTCFHCGLLCELGPLHALVMTAFYLATAGRPGEDLFGAVAYYLALVANGVSPTTQHQVSTSHLFQVGSEIACDHEEMTPFTMAAAVQDELAHRNCSRKVLTGWAVFTEILRNTELSYDAATGSRSGRYDSDDAIELEMMDPDMNVWTTVHMHETRNRVTTLRCFTASSQSIVLLIPAIIFATKHIARRNLGTVRFSDTSGRQSRLSLQITGRQLTLTAGSQICFPWRLCSNGSIMENFQALATSMVAC